MIDERTKIVAKKVSEYLRKTNRFDKTIVFCVDIEHAERMRQALAIENSDLALENYKYIMRITGDDDEGKREVDNFINPEERYPVIATTSKLMTTGVDAQTCKLIVLDSNIKSMTEFKQIIGRGTRINEDYDKTFFAIMDFRNVTDLFADPAFDGDPVMIKEVKGEEELTDQDIHPEEDQEIIDPETGQPVDFEKKNRLNTPHNQEIIQGGSIVSEPKPKGLCGRCGCFGVKRAGSASGCKRKTYHRKPERLHKKSILQEFQSLDDFLARWNSAHKKKAVIEELESHGIIPENLMAEVKKDLDVFDLICHIAWDMPALTRRERAEQVKKRNYFTKYGEKARIIINALLDKYASEGIENIEDFSVLRIDPFNQIGTPAEIVQIFGGRGQYLHAIEELEHELYAVA